MSKVDSGLATALDEDSRTCDKHRMVKSESEDGWVAVRSEGLGWFGIKKLLNPRHQVFRL